jgi:hypothetical protein
MTAKPYLITNYHVAAGRDPRTGQPRHQSAAVPDQLAVLHLLSDRRQGLSWQARFEVVLTEDGDARWLEHPKYGRGVDVVALPLTELEGVELHPYDITGAVPQMATGPASAVCVVGFPFGLTAGGAFGIWTRGFVASEPEIGFDDKPLFLIDARTREGQSGSPVVAYHPGGIAAMANGDSAAIGAGLVNLLGVYSGRVNQESDLGLVWKLSAVDEILAGQKVGHAGL